MQFHAACSEQCAYGLRDASLAADDFSQIIRMRPQFEDGRLRSFNGSDSYILRSVYEGCRYTFYKVPYLCM